MTRRKKIAVLAGVLGATIAASAAFAAWIASGTGDGKAKAITAQLLTTIDAAASTTAELYPGKTGELKITIDNPNPYRVKVTAVSGNGTITSNIAACNAGGTGVTYADQSGLSLLVNAGSSATFTLPASVSMSNASDNACQGAIFTIPVSLTGESFPV